MRPRWIQARENRRDGQVGVKPWDIAKADGFLSKRRRMIPENVPCQHVQTPVTRQYAPMRLTADDYNTTDNQKPRATTCFSAARVASIFRPSLPGLPVNLPANFQLPIVTACTAITANTETVALFQVLNNVDNPESRRIKLEACGQMQRPAFHRQ